MELHTGIESLDDGTRVLTVAGEIDLHTAPAFHGELQAALEQRCTRLVVDLTGCDYLDSTGIHVLAQARSALGEAAGKLSLVVPQPTLRRIFKIAGLKGTLTIYASRDEALQAPPRRPRQRLEPASAETGLRPA